MLSLFSTQYPLIEKLAQHVVESAKNKDFIHHEWFFDHHLRIVDKCAYQLCQLYPDADKENVAIMVWMHDYDKVAGIAHEQRDQEYSKCLAAIGFTQEVIDKTLHHIDRMERKNEIDIAQEAIDVQIISSSDGCSHFVGPFMSIYWREHPNKSIADLMLENIKKADKDILRKITLPEAKAFVMSRYHFLMESMGMHEPEQFFL